MKPLREISSDVEIALFLSEHIDNPCIDPITGENIRYFYIQLAERFIPEFKDPYARDILHFKIKEYS